MDKIREDKFCDECTTECTIEHYGEYEPVNCPFCGQEYDNGDIL
jgi:hypothetical protein